jgi:glyoxylase-like metal-dependent hydrolase (beta-lactamase superfamily II)
MPVTAGRLVGLTPGLLKPERMTVGSIVIDPGSPGLITLSPRGRARMALRGFSGSVPTAESAVRQIVRRWPDHAGAIQRVRPYQFQVRDGHPEDGELRILICWTANDARRRTMLYELGPDIATTVGWYPLITGAWRQSSQDPAVIKARGATWLGGSFRIAIGRLELIRDLAGAGAGDLNGVSIELAGEEGSVLLDLGMDVANPTLQLALRRARVIIVSHAHRDHAGGLVTALHESQAPLLMTQNTLLQLLAIHMTSPETTASLIRRVRVIRIGQSVDLADGHRLEWWGANHAPGSVVTLVTTPDGQRLLYTGDISVTNSYSDSLLRDISGRSDHPMPRSIDLALLDGTFLRTDRIDVAANGDLRHVVETAMGRNHTMVIVCDAADVASLLYIELFKNFMTGPHETRSLQVHVDPSLASLLTLMSSSFTEGRPQDLDPLFRTLWQRRQNAFESHQLWNIDDGVGANVQFHALTGKPQLFLLTTSFLSQRFAPLVNALEWLNSRGIDVLLVGRAARSAATASLKNKRWPAVSNQGFPLKGTVSEMDDTRWLLHSDPKDLFAWMAGDLGQQLERIRLFHNFPKRVQKLLASRAQRNVAPLAAEERTMFHE